MCYHASCKHDRQLSPDRLSRGNMLLEHCRIQFDQLISYKMLKPYSVLPAFELLFSGNCYLVDISQKKIYVIINVHLLSHKKDYIQSSMLGSNCNKF